MDIPEYVSRQEVRRFCKALGIRDWSRMGRKPRVTIQEARKILRRLDTGGMKVDAEQFRAGLEVELEHGTMFPAFNVTNNHPLLTAKIVMAHFMEMPDYYLRLEVAELEGDLHDALAKKNMARARNYHRRIAKARQELAKAEERGI